MYELSLYISRDFSSSLAIEMYETEFLIGFEAWAKMAQKWLVCVPLGIHLEPVTKELMLLVRI